MTMTINGSGTITGLSVGGLPDGTINANDLASNAVTTAKILDANVTQAKLETLCVPLGVGQTWTTVSRSFGTTYTNSLGRPIMVVVVATNSSTAAGCSITVDGVIANRVYGYASGAYYTVCAIVPSGSTYSAAAISSSTILSWTELR